MANKFTKTYHAGSLRESLLEYSKDRKDVDPRYRRELFAALDKRRKERAARLKQNQEASGATATS